MFLQSVTHFAHELWLSILKPNSTLVDATCGNGHDTLFLARQLDSLKGCLIGLDIQPEAIENTSDQLKAHLKSETLSLIKLIQGCHSHIDRHVSRADFIVFNLGYLPGSDKQVKTKWVTTLCALNRCLEVLNSGGYLSVTCYPGHDEGRLESEKIKQWAQDLPSNAFTSCLHFWLNRSANAPYLILIEKR